MTQKKKTQGKGISDEKTEPLVFPKPALPTEEQKKNRIQEYFSKTEKNTKGNELFRIDNSNVDIKTELSEQEIRHVNTLMFNDEFLKSRGLKPVFSKYYDKFMRLKISLERKGRTEYVKINSDDKTDSFLETAGGLSNILQARK